MKNKKRSKLAKWAAVILVRIWQVRFAAAVGTGYAALLIWLSVGAVVESVPTVAESSAPPEWSAPGENSWFGKNESGIDLFQLSRAGMANSLGFAAASAIVGVFIALLITTIFAMGKNPNRFRFLQRFSLNTALLPAFFIVLVVAAGSKGDIYAVIATISIVLAFSLVGVIGNWCEEVESGGDVLAGMTLGMTRMTLVRKRTLPLVAKKCLALVSALIPTVLMAEMALSFLGFLGDRISCGRIIATGRDYLIEAPWISVYPGILATIILVILSGLSWCVARLTKVDLFPRVF